MVVYIKGGEMEIDAFNPDELERFEDAIDETAAKVKRAEKEKRASVGIRKQCESIIECLDKVFGDGAAVKILGTKTNLLDCLDAFGDLCLIHETMNAEIESKTAAFKEHVEAYSATRAERR